MERVMDSPAACMPPDLQVRTVQPNNCFKLRTGEFCLVHNINDNISSVTCEVFMESTKLFKSPCDSRLIGVHKVHFKRGVMKQLPIQMLKEKAILVELDSRTAAISSLLHNNVSS